MTITQLPTGNTSTSVTFTREKETANTVRFKEVVENDDSRPVVGTLYVSNETLEAAGNPDATVVSIILTVVS